MQCDSEKPLNTKPFIMFNYLGEFESNHNPEIKGNDALDISLGKNISVLDQLKYDNYMTISGMISSGILSFEISYNNSKFSDETVKRLCEQFRDSLLKLSDYCINFDGTVNTASDFSDDLDIEDFNSILDLL